MPAISVSVDEKLIATVSTVGLDVLTVGARGTVVDEKIADLDVSGGGFPEGGVSSYLTWVHEVPLMVGQVLKVTFLESAVNSHNGKSIEELFPDEPPLSKDDLNVTAEMYRELSAHPKLREKFSFKFQSSLGTQFSGETELGAHGFGFTVLWNSSSPERARVSLHSYSLESLEKRGPMNKYVEERIFIGDSAQFVLVE